MPLCVLAAAKLVCGRSSHALAPDNDEGRAFEWV